MSGVIYKRIDPARSEDRMAVLRVCANLREMDAREIEGLRHRYGDPLGLALDLLDRIALDNLIDARLVYLTRDYAEEDPAPCGLLAAWRICPKLASLACCGTARFRRALPAVTRDLARMRDDFLAAAGVVAGQVLVLADYRDARRWLRRLGGVEAADMGPIGLNGDRYILFTWRF